MAGSDNPPDLCVYYGLSVLYYIMYYPVLCISTPWLRARRGRRPAPGSNMASCLALSCLAEFGQTQLCVCVKCVFVCVRVYVLKCVCLYVCVFLCVYECVFECAYLCVYMI